MISGEMMGGAVLALLTGGFLYYIKANGADKGKIREEINELRRQIEQVKWHYQRKDDARADNQRIYDLAAEIKAQISEINRKLDRKADKNE